MILTWVLCHPVKPLQSIFGLPRARAAGANRRQYFSPPPRLNSSEKEELSSLPPLLNPLLFLPFCLSSNIYTKQLRSPPPALLQSEKMIRRTASAFTTQPRFKNTDLPDSVSHRLCSLQNKQHGRRRVEFGEQHKLLKLSPPFPEAVTFTRKCPSQFCVKMWEIR